MTTFATSTNPLAYSGLLPNNPPNHIRVQRAPLTTDINANLGDIWENYATTPSSFYILANLFFGRATWLPFQSLSVLQFLTGNSGGPVGVDTNQNINVIGDTTTINIVGNPATHTLTASTAGTVATTYVCNTGSAIPSAGVLNTLGTAGTTTTGTGNTITIQAASSGFAWNDESGNFNAVKNNGYFCTAALTATLPASPSQGDTIKFYTKTTAIVIQANTGQVIQYGIHASSTAGTLTNTGIGNSVELVYRSADTTWNTDSGFGSWTPA